MRQKTFAFARGWIAVSVAVLTALPAGATAAGAATPAPPATPAPHVAGGYLPSGVRVAAKTPTFGGASANTVLPASVDLRSWAPPVGDQGQVGSCVAWSIGYSIMGYWANRTGKSGAPYAPLFLYMRNVAAGGAPDAGLYPGSVLANVQTAGIDTQADYWQGTTNWQTPPTSAQIANATKYRISGWSRLFEGANQGEAAKTSMQQAMASGNPVSLAMPVYNDFMSLRSHTLYNPLSGTSRGGHMVTAYAYDAQGITIRNSWGTWWGNSGDAKLSWAFVTKYVMAGYSVSGISTPSAPVAAAPTVASLSVTQATSGTSVTIQGSGLAGATSVKFGTDSASFSPVTADGVTTLLAVAPAHAAGTVDVTVTNATGTSAVSSASKFTYLPPPAAIDSITPSSGLTVGTTAAVVSGSGLGSVSKVTAGGVTVKFVKVSDTSLKVTMPAHAAGAVQLRITTPSGISAESANGTFTYRTPPVPAVTAVTPASGLTYVKTPVVVTGTDLGAATKVTAGGATVKFTKISDTSLSLVLPVHAAGQVDLVVTSLGGASATGSGARFSYLAPAKPAISALQPSSGSAVTTNTVYLSGANFTAASTVTGNGKKLKFVKVSDTQLRVTVPRVTAGAVQIAVTTPGGLSTPAVYTAVAPVSRAR